LIAAASADHLIFRTEWVYATRGRNFLLTILRLATQREELRIVCDQIGSPTWSREIARATTEVLEQLMRQGGRESPLSHHGGTYHMTAAGVTNWYEFMLAILEEATSVPSVTPWLATATGGRPLIARRVIPITTSEYSIPARRPRTPSCRIPIVDATLLNYQAAGNWAGPKKVDMSHTGVLPK
jgi:dTDP-4-dehydrorhamnose reductase